ncbi:MAG: flavodoxin family protein [bacterium]
MKVTTILGSPRKKGNTAKALEVFEAEMKSRGHKVKRVNLSDKTVKGCTGCFVCAKTPDAPGCPLKDDAQKIFDAMIGSDALVYATPLYCWCFSGQMKILLDRHVSLVTGYGTASHKSLIEGRKAALLVTCEDKAEGNADLIQTVFDRMSGYTKVNITGKYIMPDCTTPEKVAAKAARTGRKMAVDFCRA